MCSTRYCQCARPGIVNAVLKKMGLQDRETLWHIAVDSVRTVCPTSQPIVQRQDGDARQISASCEGEPHGLCARSDNSKSCWLHNLWSDDPEAVHKGNCSQIQATSGFATASDAQPHTVACMHAGHRRNVWNRTILSVCCGDNFPHYRLL